MHSFILVTVFVHMFLLFNLDMIAPVDPYDYVGKRVLNGFNMC